MEKGTKRDWRQLATRQAGLLSRTQLAGLGHDRHLVQNQVRAGRWQLVSPVVVATFTGILTREQLMWAGTLHAGPQSVIGGLTALERLGLQKWHRDDITVLVPKSRGIEPLAGVRFVECRRNLSGWRTSGDLPVWKVEPAALHFAAYEPVTRTAYGLMTAVVQQRLTTSASLERWLARMRPLRRAPAFRRVLEEISGGAHSMAELDLARVCRRFGLPRPSRQARRRDSSGRNRYTDAEWRLTDGTVVRLEVDGAFHMDVESWSDDIERERGLAGPGIIQLRCTSIELRDSPESLVRDLFRLGVGRSSA